MQTVTASDLELIRRHAKITLYAYVDGERLDADIGSCEYFPSCGDDETFSFGNACAAGITIQLGASMPQLKNHRIRLNWSVSNKEYPLFAGKIANAAVSAGRTTVDAWDEMYYGGSRMFAASSAMIGEASAAAAFSELAAAMGTSADEATLAMLAGVSIPEGLEALSGKCSNSEAAGYVAALVGGNSLINRSGLLAISVFNPTDWSTEPYVGGAEAADADFTVTGVAFLKESIATIANADGTSGEEEDMQTFTAGDGSLLVANPLGSQDAADWAFASLEGLCFRPGQYSFPGWILLEPGDLFTLVSMDGPYTVAAIRVTMSIDGGVKTTVSAGGMLDDGGAAGAINQALRALEADLAQVRYLIAENASIVSAKITNLSVEDLKAGRICSTDFEASALPLVYPGSDIFPSEFQFPSNGEEIIRGIEIDFATGTIRGVFFSSMADEITSRISDLDDRIKVLEEKL